ncbi:MAG: hypothetical protein Tsb0020_41250 [Haliangiales bacterium]
MWTIDSARAQSPAAGEPRPEPAQVEVEVTGGCPDRATLVRELGDLGPLGDGSAGPAAPTYTLVVTPAGRRAARMVLVDPEGRRVLRRRIRSRDCEALARAFVAIVRVHLRQLPALAADREGSPPGVDDGTPAPGADTGDAGPDDPGDDRVDAAALDSAEPTPNEATEEATDLTSQQTPARSGLTLALTAGLQQSVAPTLSATGADIELSWHSPSGPWLGRLGVSVAAPTTQTLADDDTDLAAQRVERWPAGIHAAVGVRTARAPWFYEAGVGAGLVATRVTALDLADRPSQLRTQPVVTLHVALARALWGRLRLRAELDARGYARRDRYRVAPLAGAVRSPRFEVLAKLGIELDVIERIVSSGSGH